MIIHAISDLHGFEPNLPGGDLLIIAGDCTACDGIDEWLAFFKWVDLQDYQKKVIVAGNHDNFLVNRPDLAFFCGGSFADSGIDYLLDSGIEFKGLKIWGSPWTDWFANVNPVCKAFMDKPDVLGEKFNLIPQDTDILITHTPPLYILDCVGFKGSCGSPELTYAIPDSVSLHIFGHIHDFGGKWFIGDERLYVNASVVNESYEHTIDYVEIEYDEKDKKVTKIKTVRDLLL